MAATTSPKIKGLPAPTPANTVSTLQAGFLPVFLRPDGTIVYSSMDTFKAFLLGTTPPAPTVTITGLSLSLLSAPPAASPANTVVGNFGATVSGGALVNSAWSLVNSASGDFKVPVGSSELQLAVNNLPAGTYTIRARLAADNAAALEQDFTVTIAAAAPPVTGAGGGIDFDFGYGRAADLAIPFSYKAVTAMAAGEVVQSAQPTARGDLPLGWRWYALDAGGNRVDVQQDMEGTFKADGSLETSALTITNAAARAAGTVVPLTLKAEQVAPNRAPLITLAQIKTELADLKVEVSGYDLGPDTFVGSPRWVLDNCKEWTAASPGFIATSGVAPVGGWQWLKRGLQAVDLLVWGYYRNAALTASHRWLRFDALLQRLPSGAWDIGWINSQPNAFNAHPAGTLGPVKQARMACVAKLKNGATVLRTWGDATDPNTVTRPSSAITGDSRVDFAGGFADDRGGDGTVLGIIGNGATPSHALGHIHHADGGLPFLTVERHVLTAGKVTFTGTSAGINFVPLPTTWPNGRCALYEPDGTRFRWGGSTRPTVLAMHNKDYLLKRAKVVPAMNESLPEALWPGQAKPKFISGSANHFWWFLAETSNGSEDDRLGYITASQAGLLMVPHDEARHRRTIVDSLCFLTFPVAHVDEEAGVEVVYNHGPAGDGAGTYPGHGAITTQFTGYSGYNPIGIGYWTDANPPARAPGHFFDAKWKQRGGIPGYSEYSCQYDVILEGSHAPNFHLVPWLRTADYAHLIGLRACGHMINSANNYPVPINGVTQPVTVSGGRTFAWTQALMSTAESALPDGSPCKQMLFDMTAHNALYFADGATQTHEGRFIGQIFGKGASYMMAYAHIVVGHEVLKNKHPKWAAVLEKQAAIWNVDQYDDAQGPIPNGAHKFGMYGNDADNAGEYWPSLMAFKIGTQDQFGALPFPSTGFQDGFGGLTFTARAEMGVLRIMASCNAMGLVNIQRAKPVADAIIARGLNLDPAYDPGTGKVLPLWDIVSIAPPPATAVPNGITGEAASNVKARSALIAWTRPTQGGAIVTYKIEVKKGSAAYVTVHEDWGRLVLPLKDLADNAANLVRITPRNPAGLSATSTIVTVNTPVEVTGTLTGATAYVGTPAAFIATFSNAASVWVCLTSAATGVDITGRVQITGSGNSAQLTSTTIAPQYGSMYNAQTGGDLIDTTPTFTPAPSQASLYDFTWEATRTNPTSTDPYNTNNGSYTFACHIQKKSNGGKLDNLPTFILCLTGTSPTLATGGFVMPAKIYEEGAFFSYYVDYVHGYLGAASYDLWVFTADGEASKHPVVHVRT